MPDLDSLDHDRYVARTLELARDAGERGDGPYGSLLVRDGTVIAEATNRVRSDDDLALHPELTLARRAANEYSVSERSETVMYTSTEPCPMCATGIAFAQLGGVVYATQSTLGSTDGDDGLPCAEVFDRLGRDVPVVGPIREAEGVAVRREFE